MGHVPDADMAQSWFEKFPDTTKEEARKALEVLSRPEVRAAVKAERREERRRARQAELAARGTAGMNIMVLTYEPVSSMYAATLMLRGHQIGIFGSGIITPDLVEEIEDYYDGCLLLGTEPELLEIANMFEQKGKKVWRQLADIPRERDRSGP